MPTVTKQLKELGPNLPLGLAGPGGGWQRSLACKPWRGLEEREVGRLRLEGRDDGTSTTKLLAYMYEQIGDHNFSDMSMPEREVVISQMYFGDALYAYVWLRVQCVGPELVMDMTCPHCAFEFKYSADLNTIEVRTAEDVEAVTWEYELKTPFELRGKEVATLELQPNRWASLVSTLKTAVESGSNNPNAAKMDVLRSCISAIPGHGPVVLAPTELDYMTKLDIEALASKIDDYGVGPDMLVSDKCQRCRRRFRVSLDWDYASFFEVSSQS